MKKYKFSKLDKYQLNNRKMIDIRPKKRLVFLTYNKVFYNKSKSCILL